jgi:hypothetical protein
MPIDVIPPPERFDHDYDGPVIEMVIPWDRITKMCDLMSNAGKIVLPSGATTMSGCSRVYLGGGNPPVSGGCLIIIPAEGSIHPKGPVTVKDQEKVFHHERAHCNGWPADHPK